MKTEAEIRAEIERQRKMREETSNGWQACVCDSKIEALKWVLGI